MLTVNISEFRANLLKYLESANSGEDILVTSNGKILATVSAPSQVQNQAREALAALRKNAKVGDVISSTANDWNALL